MLGLNWQICNSEFMPQCCCPWLDINPLLYLSSYFSVEREPVVAIQVAAADEVVPVVLISVVSTLLLY